MANLSDDERLVTVCEKFDRETAYFTRWAQAAHIRYQVFNIASIVFGAAVPVIALVPGLWGGDSKPPWVIAAAGISGAIATLFRSIDGFLKDKENWIQTSHLLAKLRGERFLFETRAGRYADSKSDVIALYASTIDGLIQQETDTWFQTVQRPITGGSA